MRIEIENGWIETLPNPTPDEVRFVVEGTSACVAFSVTLRQLTMLRENLNDLIDFLQEDHETDNVD